MVINRLLLLTIGIVSLSFSKAQVAPDYYWIGFTDKQGTGYRIDAPEAFLSQQAIERRALHYRAITTTDLPVSKTYLDSLKTFAVNIHMVSKWLNGVVVHCEDIAVLQDIYNLDFTLESSVSVETASRSYTPKNKFETTTKQVAIAENHQLTMLNGHLLHDAGFKGKGKLIAILDAGFESVDKADAFQYLYDNNKILLSRDFIRDKSAPYDGHYHGTMVLSTIACDTNLYPFPTAPDASFLLLRTENPYSEYIIEEYNWIAGAELADSMGADIINSSLGYSEFYDASQNHTYGELDGNTAPATIGADIAASRGIVVVNSAGNSYNDPWRYITTPADGDSVLTVGAVQSNGVITSFSSRGPSADRRIKPDVVAMGGNCFVVAPTDILTQSSGTSFSSPITAGMVACLWQAVPEATSWEIIDAIKQSSNQNLSPDSTYGYGLPDFWRAKEIALNQFEPLTELQLFPNPLAHDSKLTIALPWIQKSNSGIISVFNSMGQLVQQWEFPILANRLNIELWSRLSSIEKGIYHVQLAVDNRYYSSSFLKL